LSNEKKIKWKRNCPNPDHNPNCEKEIFYTQKSSKNRAEKRNTNCKSCASTGRIFSSERNKKIGESISGERNGMYGKSVYDMWVEKYGIDEALKREKVRKEKYNKSIEEKRK